MSFLFVSRLDCDDPRAYRLLLCYVAYRYTLTTVIKGYKNEETCLIAERGRVTKKVLRILPRELHEKARVKLAVLDAAESLEVLRAYPGLDVKTFGGIYQMRINDTYRIRFTWDGNDADNVEIGDFHQ